MKHPILKTILILLITACGVSKNTTITTPEYFEGVVTYSIEYYPYSENHDPARIEELVGNKFIMTYKEGDFSKEFYSPSGELLYEYFMDLEAGKVYNKFSEHDTIFVVDITKNDTKGTFTQKKDSVILNYPTTVLETKSVLTFPHNLFREVYGEEHYAKDLKVNPEWYKNCLEDNFNERIEVGKGIQLLTMTKGAYWKVVMVAIDVKQRTVDDDEIKLRLNGNEIIRKL